MTINIYPTTINEGHDGIAVVGSNGGSYKLKFDAVIPDAFGSYAEQKTVREAIEDGTFAVWDDEEDGDSHGLHGHAYYNHL